MSSASRPEVYQRTLSDEKLWDRLLFGSDCPYGIITGVEQWSEQTGPTFVTRDTYPWTHPTQAPAGHADLSYNTYHTIKAVKDALDALPVDVPTADAIKQKVFHDNAATLFS